MSDVGEGEGCNREYDVTGNEKSARVYVKGVYRMRLSTANAGLAAIKDAHLLVK